MVLQPFSGVDLAPGEYTVQETFENEFTGGRWENRDILGGLVDSATSDSGHTSYTNIIRAGVMMGQVTSTGKLRVFDPTATNGAEELVGILKQSLKLDVNGTAQNRFTGNLIRGGIIDPTKIILSSLTSASIVGTTYEFHIRKLLVQAGFKVQDAFWEVPYGGVRKTVAKTADYTITNADRNCRFTNAGASGAVVFTLPATAALGLEYWFTVEANQDVTITAGTADTMIAYNDIAADSIAFATANEKVGGGLYVRGNGSKWVAEVRLGFESQTITIAT